MPRLGHGRPITEQDVTNARNDVAEVATRSRLSFALTPPVSTHSFDLLFPTLQEDEVNLLPVSPGTLAGLKALGASMEDQDTPGEDSPIPAAYTYLGQFIDHDITLEAQQPGFGSGTVAELLDPDMQPLPLADIRNALRNLRTATLDLDSLYGLPAPRVGDKLGIGPVFNLDGEEPPTVRPPGKSDDNDLPREGPSDDITHDRAALIGDPRNDENLIVSQLHVAFLKAHNALIDQGLPFTEARRVLRQHYQHIVVHDFLKKVADPAIVDDIVTNGNRWFDPHADAFFMPLEFAVAGYRFGHSLVRGTYDFNLNFPEAELEQLFTFTALSGQLGGLPRLPDNWIIQWERIVGDDGQKTRRMDTNLARVGGRALFALQTVDGQNETPQQAAQLAVRNLLRGYRLRMPTGQAVATLLDVPVLSKDDLIAVAQASSPAQGEALTAHDFQSRTPLWYYVLAEAQHFHGGAHLGPVGSTLVAEVLVGLVRRSEDSILKQPAWQPTLPSARPGTFELADLLRLAGVLEGTVDPRTYTVRSGDTLTRIAQNELGDGNRWPEIFLLNRAVIRNPNRIFPGQVLVLPPREPAGPIPRLYVVERGDTLSGIARAELGDANRWREIFDLNRDVISNPDRIIPGQILALPR
ncbi:LysM peptidoglycan-binding domain-containing protein [Actinoplanes sp. NPDC024001]|uniref:LysM peptidoglycan-binding domain-containing protein n=1 Tax=Actinoplanes sp. NPDC024001 TaxID=3154598 RepID=UPI0033FBF830